MSVLPIQYYSNNSEFGVPTKAYDNAAGYDLYSAEKVTILPHSCEGVNCKFYMAIPEGYFGKVFSRSGLVKHHLITAEAGVIDSDYRGEVYVILINHGKEIYTVEVGESVAQIIFMEKENVEFIRFNKLTDLGKTKRGSLGFGSTGIKKKLKIDSDDEDEKTIIVVKVSMRENGKQVIKEKTITIE